MRTRQRLVEIMLTVNPELYPKASRDLFGAAIELDTGFYTDETPDTLQMIAEFHESSHIRELAEQALKYWGVKP